jgi:ABC-type branched-subunit amino acid transport system substrate-binding protein
MSTCAGVVLFPPSNVAQMFTTHPDRGLYFRATPPAAVLGTVLGRLVVADGNATVVVVVVDGDVASNDIGAAMVAAIQESGGRVLDSFHYDPNARNYSKVIQRVRDKNPDAIVLIGFSEALQFCLL